MSEEELAAVKNVAAEQSAYEADDRDELAEVLEEVESIADVWGDHLSACLDAVAELGG